MAGYRFKVRFHLGAGTHFMHWQVTDSITGEVTYFDPTRFAFHLNDCRLRNQPGTAQKIHGGANKTVCAWIECAGVLVTDFGASGLPQSIESVKIERGAESVRYNPRIAPYWRNSADANVDGSAFTQLFVSHRSVFCL